MEILVGVDGSEASRLACRFVAERTWPLHTRVRLLTAHEPPSAWTSLGPPPSGYRVTTRPALEAELEGLADALRRAGLSVQLTVARGHPAELLIEWGRDTAADLIVVGNRGLGPLGSAVLGSVSAHLTDHAECPVLVVRSPSVSRMLLAADGTTSSASIPRVLDSWGPAFAGVPVEVISVAEHEPALTPWSMLENRADALRHDMALHREVAERVVDELVELGWNAISVVSTGDPARAIVSTSRDWGADLIVTGSRGIGTLQRLVLGSVSHEVLLHARASVLVVRGAVPARALVRQAVARPAFG